MGNNVHGDTRTEAHATDTMSPGGRAAASEGESRMRACGMRHKGLKGLFWMVACCAAPLMLVLAWPVLGIGLGGRTAPVVSTLTVLACPVSMMLMMWMMRRQGADAQPSTDAQSLCGSPVVRSAPPTPAVNRHAGTV